MKQRRLEREYAWMCRLQTVYPFGLNSKIRNIGIVKENLNLEAYNIYNLGRYYDKSIKRRGKRKKRRRGSGHNGTVTQVDIFMRSIVNLTVQLELKFIRNRSVKFIRKCMRRADLNVLPIRIRKMLDDRQGFVQRQLPKNKTSNMTKRLKFQVNFKHKAMGIINLRSIISRKEVRDLVPVEAVYKDVPMFYFKYQKNISREIFNFNSDDAFQTIEDLNNLACECDELIDRTFINDFYGHVLTGDLNIIQNEALKSIMKKGAKFRDSPDISLRQIEYSLIQDIKNYRKMWMEKEKAEVEEEVRNSWEDKLIEWERLVCHFLHTI